MQPAHVAPRSDATAATGANGKEALYDPVDVDTPSWRSSGTDSTAVLLKRLKIIAAGAVGVAVVLLIALVIVLRRPNPSPANGPSCAKPSALPEYYTPFFTDESKIQTIIDRFAATVDNSSIKAFMTQFSRYPHMTASPRNLQLAQDTANYYKQFGFDDAWVESIPVLLPQLVDRSVTVNDVAGVPRYAAVLTEPNILAELNYTDALLPSNGYSGQGDVTAPIVWVNYGRAEDFKAAAEKVNLKGVIAVARYGKIFRGNKAAFAQQFGAVGCIIVMDPADVAKGAVLPDGPWATNMTVQRGSLALGEGDPRTPTWPSEAGGPVLDGNDFFDAAKMAGTPLPTIPVQPMGYGDASEMLRGIGGVPAPSNDPSWADTGFADVTKGRIGPSNYTVRLVVNRNLVVQNLANAHGVIRGVVEPDKVVVIGGHRDAWTYGAVDPISGASISLEVARCLGELLKTGWKPRRTIHFASWGGEEQSLLGSTEWVEANVEMLRERAVAYINLDTPVTGTDVFTLEGSPSFETLAMNAAGQYSVGGTSLLARMGSKPHVDPPGSGSDHTGFIQLAGVPVLVPELTSNDGRYDAVYHTNYDSVYWVEHFGDPVYEGHRALARFVGDAAIRLATLNVVPLHPGRYAANVQSWMNDYATANGSQVFDFTFANAKVQSFVDAGDAFETRAVAVQAAIQSEYPYVKTVSPFELSALNDRIVGLERVFLGTSVETLSQFFKHVLFTPSPNDSYGSSVMPLVAQGLATGVPATGNFALGRIAQYIGRAASFINTTNGIV